MLADSERTQDAGPKARIFISYSRRDTAFADRLDAALKARSFETLIDREEIVAFEDWWKRIEVLISRADTVVFVLSPDAVTSDVALKEVVCAASLNKRFAPIVCRPVKADEVPDALRRLNFIFFDDASRFEASADELAEALQTDIGWIRYHTEYGEAARRWSAAGRPDGLLLRSPALEEAERWIASRPHSTPGPTPEMQLFIARSRRGAVRRRRRALALIGGFAAALVAILVAWQNQDRLKERIYATLNVSALNTAEERLLMPKDTFKECTKCPEMIVVPAGSYTLGWGGIWEDLPLHSVTFSKPFAISRREVTFEEWTACIANGTCDPLVKDQNGTGSPLGGLGWHSVGDLSWDAIQNYVMWLSRITGKNYRLLSEAEYEYAVRIGAAELGGWEMFQDCWHKNLDGAPSDGSPWIDAAGTEHVGRVFKSRVEVPSGSRMIDLSFRIARTLSAEANAAPGVR
jgi:TIR domain/Sulfatase-modifying factor enzyme 1